MVFNISIKHWHAVAEWTWSEGDDDMCGICRNAHDGCAPDVKYPGDDSPVVWGACAHAFHLQCIQKWLASNTEQRCPICRRPWQYKGAGDGDQEEEDEPSQNESEDPEEQQREYEEDEEQVEEEQEEEQDEELGEQELAQQAGGQRGQSEERDLEMMHGLHDELDHEHRRLTSNSTLELESQGEGRHPEEGEGADPGLFAFLHDGRGSHSGDRDAPQPMRWEGSDTGGSNPEAQPTTSPPLRGGYGGRSMFDGAGRGEPVPRFDLGLEGTDFPHSPGFHSS